MFFIKNMCLKLWIMSFKPNITLLISQSTFPEPQSTFPDTQVTFPNLQATSPEHKVTLLKP